MAIITTHDGLCVAGIARNRLEVYGVCGVDWQLRQVVAVLTLHLRSAGLQHGVVGVAIAVHLRLAMAIVVKS